MTRMVTDDASFEAFAIELTANLPGLIQTSGYAHKPGGGAIGWHGFEVSLSIAPLRRAIGNRPAAGKVAALVSAAAVIAHNAYAGEFPVADFVEDIQRRADRSGVRATAGIKLIASALAEVTAAVPGRHRNDDRQGLIVALELLAKHFGKLV